MSEANFISTLLLPFALTAFSSAGGGYAGESSPSEYHRPAELAALLSDGDLKTQLESCNTSGLASSALSIGHRGAPLEIPEHTREGYIAAADQGAETIECDVTFTKDRELVCRHSQCDLHTTTDILQTPLAANCTVPPDPDSATPYANIQCCTSDITLSEFRTLRGKRDGGDKNATSLEDYFAATPGWEPGSGASFGELLSHRDSIELFDNLGVSMIPELKAPQVPMPFEGDYSQSMYASQMLNDYVAAGIEPSRVFPQSFNLEDIQFWLQTAPEFGGQAAFLDGRYRDDAFDINDSASWSPTMDELVADGVRYLASPLWMLVTLDSSKQVIASDYSRAAKAAGLNLIAWTIERGGAITSGKNWYYQSTQPAIETEGDVFKMIDVLVKEVGVAGIFSDWPATTSYYAHCIL